MTSTENIKTKSRTIDVDNIHSNITPEILEITIDKLKIVLLENEKKLSGSNAWHTPLALSITIILVLCTTEFKDFAGIKGEIWCAIFIISTILNSIWLIKCLYNIKHRMTIEELIDCMKKRA
ncbi:hypothetical protein O3299_00575 [Janthinobacterium sp. SUN176]|uniref:hypothetical protein n=1 Tax=Janthinobacterium sp. SUN176 TaxID=3014788 RepID=UPI002713FF2C|nr:hypothetical protein [Janthinobacterium sp. SUN176]MDO8070005.1 hypothetical protein [Janthinobacterium sp. SUN176]